jgi:NTE family protein
MRILALLLSTAMLVVILTGAVADAASSGPSPNACAGQRALVITGGGFTGYAWEIGMLKGLRDAGIELRDADLIVGTSAGSLVGAQLASGMSLDVLYDRMRNPARGRGATGPAPPRVDMQYLLETFRLWQDTDASAEQRIEVGRRALAAVDVVSEDDLVDSVVRGFGITEWPGQPLVISATGAFDGASWLFDRTQGVPVERAVAASIAIPVFDAPITVGERRFMDGGVSGTHFDAAIGYPCIVGITPGGGPAAIRQIEALRTQGSQVLRLEPDAASEVARGPNPSDVTRQGGSAEAGLRQAMLVAAEVGQFWNGAAR